jgi:hypothetical protein
MYMQDSVIQEVMMVLPYNTEIMSRKIAKKMATIIASWKLLLRLTMRREQCTLTASHFKLTILPQSIYRTIWMQTKIDSVAPSSPLTTLQDVASMYTKSLTQVLWRETRRPRKLLILGTVDKACTTIKPVSHM